MPQGPLVAVGKPMLTLGGLEEDHLEGRYPGNVVSRCQGLVQEAKSSCAGSLWWTNFPLFWAG